MKGVISICLKNEIYYHWVEVLFKSILLHANIEFSLVYDNELYFKKYNLDKLVKYPIYKTDIVNPYLFKYELINYTPFDNSIFFDADTIIFKDITPLFSEQFLSICAEWDSEWIYDDFSFIKKPEDIVKIYNLKKLYSAYSGYIRFEKTNFYYNLFKKVLANEHYNRRINKIYSREFMPDEYFLNISISDLKLNRFIPIKLYYSNHMDDLTNYYGYTLQGSNKVELEYLNDMVVPLFTNIEIKNYLLLNLRNRVNKELIIFNNKLRMTTVEKKNII